MGSTNEDQSYERCAQCREKIVLLLKEDVTEFYETCCHCEKRLCNFCLTACEGWMNRYGEKYAELEERMDLETSPTAMRCRMKNLLNPSRSNCYMCRRCCEELLLDILNEIAPLRIVTKAKGHRDIAQEPVQPKRQSAFRKRLTMAQETRAILGVRGKFGGQRKKRKHNKKEDEGLSDGMANLYTNK